VEEHDVTEELGEAEDPGEVTSGGALLRRVLRSGRRDLAIGSGLAMIHQAAEALVPVVIGIVIDRAVETGDTGALVRWIAALAGLFVCLSSAGCVGVYVYERVVTRAGHQARMALVRRVLDPRGGAEAENLPGELVSLASVDTNRIGEGMGMVMLGAGAVVGTVGTATLLLATSVQLGLVVLVGLPLVLVAVRLLARPLERRSGAEHAAVAAASGVATDLMTGLRVLKGIGAEAAAAARYRRASRLALGGALRTARVEGGYEALTITMGGAFLVVVAWLGGRLALDGDLTIGQLVAALGLTQFLVGPLNRVAFVAATLAQAQAAAGRIAAVCAVPPETRGGTVSLGDDVRGELRIATPAGGFELVVGAGETVGVVCRSPEDALRLLALLDGPVGSATTLALDGVPLGDAVLDDRRRAVLVARHDAALFEETLVGNVAVAAGSPEQVDAAIRAAGADEVAEVVDGGLDAEVGEDGRALSGGQRQRVALARALATDTPVLVLEDPLTAVDAVTEHRVAQRLRSLRDGRTTVLVTSSPALLAVADRVVLVDEGHVVVEGTHVELAGSDERYRTAVLS
jgi:putative ABC transport system ATP-binding protein